MTKVCFISVVRDFDLYNRVIVNNPHLGDAQKIAYDNRAENRPIPTRYNEFLRRMRLFKAGVVCVLP